MGYGYVIKRGWTQITSGRLWDLYMEVFNEAKRQDFWNKAAPMLFTRKSIQTLGMCANRRQPDGTYLSSIVISEVLLTLSDDKIRETLVHEFAHACRPKDGHGYFWYVLCGRLGAKWGYQASRTSDDEEVLAAFASIEKYANKYRYELYCPTCGATWKYKCKCQAVLHPSRYQCKKDKTKLLSREIIKEAL